MRIFAWHWKPPAPRSWCTCRRASSPNHPPRRRVGGGGNRRVFQSKIRKADPKVCLLFVWVLLLLRLLLLRIRRCGCGRGGGLRSEMDGYGIVFPICILAISTGYFVANGAVRKHSGLAVFCNLCIRSHVDGRFSNGNR